MSIQDTKKVDLLWKKLGYGVSKTDDANRKSPSNESIASPLLIRGDRIWTESHLIPSVLPQTSSTVVEVKSAYLGNTVKCVEDITSTPLRTWKTSLTDWIPVEFGPTYQVKVYVDDDDTDNPTVTGTRLFADGTGSDEWYFDYSAGVLHFIGDTLPQAVVSGKVIYITGARYVGDTGLSNLDTSGSGINAVQGEIPASDKFIGDGFTHIYTLSESVTSPEAIDVYVNDVLQRPGEVYSVIDQNQLKFTAVPPQGTDIYIKYRYPFATIVDNLEGSIENRHLNLDYSSDQYTGTGNQQIYDINPGHNEHSVLVIVNGLIIPPQEYTVNGTVLTINTSPADGDVVDIRYMPV